VIHNWVAETSRFAAALKPEIFRPGMPVPKGGLVIANYTQLRLQAEWFGEPAWNAVILDEGQNIKNPGSKTAKTVRELKASHRMILTGTPIENRALDLWSLFAFAQPGLLGSQAAFKRLYETRSNEGEALGRLQSRVRHFLLRRTKGQVAPELPPRTEEELLCDLDGEQAVLYRAELKKTRSLLLGIESKSAFDKARFNILQSLLRLRQICCDPRLLAKNAEPGKDEASAKMEALFGQLRPLVDEGHKVLVFS
jgi:SNF2 family DNA or RNA helicase